MWMLRLACGQFAVFVAFTCAFLAQMIYRIDSKWPVVARFDGRPRSALVTNSLACMSTVVLAVVLVWFGVALALVVVVVGCGAQPTRQTAKTAVRSSARSVPLGRSPAPVVPGITCALMYTCCETCVGVFCMALVCRRTDLHRSAVLLRAAARGSGFLHGYVAFRTCAHAVVCTLV